MVSPRTKRRIERLLASRRPRDAAGRVVALCYHSVAPTGGVSLRPQAFREQLAWLKERCNVVPFSEIHPASLRRDRRPIVAITFDDGYRDNHEHALPALVDVGLPAAFFVTTGLIDSDPSVTRRFGSVWGIAPDRIVGLTWSQLREMHDQGMEIGAHTRTHPMLARLDAARARAEIAEPKGELEDRLQHEIERFAYPFGDARFDFSSSTVRLVREAGFRSAASVHLRGIRASDDPMMLPRFPVVNESLDVLAGIVDGRLDLLGSVRDRVPRWVSRFGWSGRLRDDGAA
jgi:peptidoglycan/xylan/chitin deacetylase (PgdA/CDA1 family)